MKLGDHKYLNLSREMTRAQFKLRDQSSFFGFLWSFLNPLIMVALLFALFSSQLSLIALFSGVPLTSVILALPLVLILQVMLVLWVSLLLSSFFVFVRDLVHISYVFLRLLFFITPIFYGLSFVGQGVGHYLLLANPMSHLIIFARNLLINGQLFEPRNFNRNDPSLYSPVEWAVVGAR